MIEIIIRIIETIQHNNNLQLYAFIAGIFAIGAVIVAVIQKKFGSFFIMLLLTFVACLPIYFNLQ